MWAGAIRIKQGRAALSALLVACAAIVPALADATPQPAPGYVANAAIRTRQACAAIAAIADRGARVLRKADLVGSNILIDLYNDGHPRKIVRLEQGTAHAPFLANEAQEPLPVQDTAYAEDVRWAYEVVVLRIKQRIWRVDWDIGDLDDAAALVGATDGTSACLFRTVWHGPTFNLLPEGKRGEAGIYRALLLGHGLRPPSASINFAAVQGAWGSLGHGFSVEDQSWRVNLMNNRTPYTLVRVKLSSGAGRGCDYNLLGQVRDNQIAVAGFQWPLLDGHPPLAGVSPSLRRVLNNVVCSSVTETPFLDRKKQIYIMLDNVAGKPDRVNRVRLLIGARSGLMRGLARLSWKTHNKIRSVRVSQ